MPKGVGYSPGSSRSSKGTNKTRKRGTFKRGFQPGSEGGKARKAGRIAAGRDAMTGKKVGSRKTVRQQVRAAIKARRPGLGAKQVAKRTRKIVKRKVSRGRTPSTAARVRDFAQLRKGRKK